MRLWVHDEQRVHDHSNISFIMLSMVPVLAAGQAVRGVVATSTASMLCSYSQAILPGVGLGGFVKKGGPSRDSAQGKSAHGAQKANRGAREEGQRTAPGTAPTDPPPSPAKEFWGSGLCFHFVKQKRTASF